MTIFTVAALPANEGDCLVISYGEPDTLRHIVIDGGRKATAPKLGQFLTDNGITRIELLVITHVDADHIEGILDFLDAHPHLIIDDIWFNGYRHLLPGLNAMGPVQGEKLTERLLQRNWNKAFSGGTICLADDGAPRVVEPLKGGMAITLLSPDRAKLAKLEPVWVAELEKVGLVPNMDPVEEVTHRGLQPMGPETIADMADMPTQTDGAEANGSSISFLATFAEKTVLFGADAHPDILCASLARIAGGAPVSLDLLKVPHHGSQANVTLALLRAIRCSHFLISTSGSRFKHPDAVAIARIIAGSHQPAILSFNYQQPKTLFWRDRVPKAGDPDYTCVFADPEMPLLIPLLT